METFFTRMIIYFFSFLTVSIFSHFSMCLFFILMFFLFMLKENKDKQLKINHYFSVGISVIMVMADIFAVHNSIYEYINPNIFGIPLWTIPFRLLKIYFIVDIYLSFNTVTNELSKKKNNNNNV